MGVPVTVIVPGSTSPEVQARIRALGATVEVVGSAWDDADAYARRVAGESGERASGRHTERAKVGWGSFLIARAIFYRQHVLCSPYLLHCTPGHQFILFGDENF